MKRPVPIPVLKAICLALFGFVALDTNGQAVTEVITTYNNYWKSNCTSISSAKPDTSHTLLAFTFNNIRYSTGVNNASLATHGDSFIPCDFKALPVFNGGGNINGNTKIGLGCMYDGIRTGPSNPVPVNNMQMYLTDGINGLNLGTGVANLPAGSISFSVSNLQSAAINNGVPDILVTQIADPGGSTDQYEFVDINGNRVGNLVSISFNSINPVANWTADFYDVNTNPMSLPGGFTNTDRPMRLWAADFSMFGITQANYSSIARFVIHLSGNSDLAFVAYNFGAATILPVQLSFFKSDVSGKDVQLSWQTASEINSDYFVVETSTDGRQYTALDTVKAAGNSNTSINYNYRHSAPGAGSHYYRLKQMDLDGKFVYSVVRKETIFSIASFGIYPNPSSGNINVTHTAAQNGDRISVYTIGGQEVLQKMPARGNTQTSIDLTSLRKGIYLVSLRKPGGEINTERIIIQ
jgi:hypothetical protein